MTLRIDRVERCVRLSGNFRSEHVHQVKAELDRCQSPVALDLEEVGLVDVEAIRFLIRARWREFLCYTAPPISGRGCRRNASGRKNIRKGKKDGNGNKSERST